MTKLSELLKKEELNTNEKNNLVNKLVSEKGTKEFKKRDYSEILPNMTCHKKLVKLFRQEAKSKRWLPTTLMNEILADRYNIDLEKLENEDD
ncbi:hypothetical protein D6D54_08395 (plasmid) [Spiroplasma poulsonii]|uniref:Uncharacterized protein n=1 Tax=Spiroplasma poulsonii TaxID=2138 RepID=A0A433EMR6_9MOLU|nr:hypothetical protein [Spiroplasma poulsonii]MBW3059431.1 hypothetical protein [Spiroplasma poulsonii]MBW3059446.1 hypothetical protein [Spiroplasma poulsonii]RUP75570.1 hypothetical protein D6D54_08395 [Spiroplasma poulsonii]